MKMDILLKVYCAHVTCGLQVTVEGNIGSGKSTFLQFFRQAETVEVLVQIV